MFVTDAVIVYVCASTKLSKNVDAIPTTAVLSSILSVKVNPAKETTTD